ncbi:hypothetical protein [Psychroserpens damuponensis]|uniref:hypothetical protein n=1 Tax=Psychroserpens damuponensis TaxID=943936 RepID=UPI0012699E4A|nr:hypothetical protein [Psychroserpens damuponensis]
MKTEKIIRILLILSLGMSTVQFLNYVVQIGTSIFNSFENPLIPKGIWKIVTFPLTFMSILYVIIAAFIYAAFKKKHLNLIAAIVLFIATIVFTICSADIYSFINSFNPYEVG